MDDREQVRDLLDEALEALMLVEDERFGPMDLWSRRHFIHLARRTVQRAARLVDGDDDAGDRRAEPELSLTG